MTLQPRPLRHERREFADAAEWRILSMINASPRTAEGERVLGLLQLLIRAEDLRQQLYEHARMSKELIHPYGQNDSELQQCLREINAHLRRYRWTPRIVSPQFHALVDSPIWDEQRAQSRENWAVRWMLDHAKGAGPIKAPISRFRQCLECRTWFYALADHAKCCSTPCRKNFNSKSPEFKAKRAKYMKEIWRPREKAETLKSLRYIRKDRRK